MLPLWHFSAETKVDTSESSASNHTAQPVTFDRLPESWGALVKRVSQINARLNATRMTYLLLPPSSQCIPTIACPQVSVTDHPHYLLCVISEQCTCPAEKATFGNQFPTMQLCNYSTEQRGDADHTKILNKKGSAQVSCKRELLTRQINTNSIDCLRL